MTVLQKIFSRRIAHFPTRILVFGYLLLILAGTFFLMLPPASFSTPLNFVDALFTSASAVCVTGLTVVDTAKTFTIFGQLIILTLIQVGGLGIMVLSTLFLMSIGKKIGLTGKMIIRDTYSLDEGKEVLTLLKEIILFTITIESIGAALLFYRFQKEMPFDIAVFNCIFHAISAFCNAGFCLFNNSFMNFRGDWIVNLTICFLIILGGIGFIVLSEVKSKFSLSGRCWSFFSLHTKLVLSSTLMMLLVSTFLFVVLEWRNFSPGMIFTEKCLTGFFQAVNARTAGFNSVSIENLTNGSLFIILLLMFIGTAPGSCGGGIKITTFSSLIILGISRLRGEEYPQIFYRKISETSISKAISVVMVSLLVIIFGIILLQQTEIGEISHQMTRGNFLELIFETVSAFGTVGLSMGITPTLSIQGKLIITIMMFIGRVGPIAVALAVSRRKTSRRFQYAQENIMIG